MFLRLNVLCMDLVRHSLGYCASAMSGSHSVCGAMGSGKASLHWPFSVPDISLGCVPAIGCGSFLSAECMEDELLVFSCTF